MFLKVKKVINVITKSHGTNFKVGDIVELDENHKHYLNNYPEHFELIPLYVMALENGDIDGIKFEKNKIVELNMSLYFMALRVYPNKFRKLTLDELKTAISEKKGKKATSKDDSKQKDDKEVIEPKKDSEEAKEGVSDEKTVKKPKEKAKTDKKPKKQAKNKKK